MTARERLRRVAGILGLSKNKQMHPHATALRTLADRLDAEMAAIETHSRTDVVAEAYKNVVRGVLRRLDAPLDVDPNSTQRVPPVLFSRKCRVCGKETGLQESDVCFDHSDTPPSTSPHCPACGWTLENNGFCATCADAGKATPTENAEDRRIRADFDRYEAALKKPCAPWCGTDGWYFANPRPTYVGMVPKGAVGYCTEACLAARRSLNPPDAAPNSTQPNPLSTALPKAGTK